jgi:hypothetical protein
MRVSAALLLAAVVRPAAAADQPPESLGRVTCRPVVAVDVTDRNGKPELLHGQASSAQSLFVEVSEAQRRIRIVSGTELTRPAKNAAAEEELKSPQVREANRQMEGFMAAEIAAASGTAMCSDAEWTAAHKALFGQTAKEIAAALRKRSEELAREPRSPTQELPTMALVHSDSKSVRGVQDTAYATTVLALDRRTLRAVFTLARAGADNAGPMGKVFSGTTGRVWWYQCEKGWPEGVR